MIRCEIDAYETVAEFVEEYGQMREINQQSEKQEETTFQVLMENLIVRKIPKYKLTEEIYTQFVSSYVTQYAARIKP